MSSISSEPVVFEARNSGHEILHRILRSRWTFVGLQVLDLCTTLAAFHFGAFEVNPLVAHFTVRFGWLRGVLLSKLIAIAIAMGVRRRVWIINLFYTLIVGWNVIMIVFLYAKPH
jgi:Domain of unknown function (DUF5658)